MIRRPPRSTLELDRRQRQMCIRDRATGQPAFRLIAVDKHTFKYDAMGISFTFDLEKNTMLLNFGGKEHNLQKE